MESLWPELHRGSKQESPKSLILRPQRWLTKECAKDYSKTGKARTKVIRRNTKKPKRPENKPGGRDGNPNTAADVMRYKKRNEVEGSWAWGSSNFSTE